jgi:hypothetical protein
MLAVAACAAVPTVLSAAVHTKASSSCVLPSFQVPPDASNLFGILSAPAPFLFSALAPVPVSCPVPLPVRQAALVVSPSEAKGPSYTCSHASNPNP